MATTAKNDFYGLNKQARLEAVSAATREEKAKDTLETSIFPFTIESIKVSWWQKVLAGSKAASTVKG